MIPSLTRPDRPSSLQRDDLLQSVANACNALTQQVELESGIQAALAALIAPAAVDRVYIFENHEDPQTGLLCVSQRYERSAASVEPQLNNPDLQSSPYAIVGPRWFELLSNQQVVTGLVRDFPQSERDILEPQSIQSLLVAPIWAGDHFWGFIGFDNCHAEEVWSPGEQAILQLVAANIGSAIARHTADEENRRQRQNFERILNAIPISIYEKDAQGRYAFVNQEMTRFLALPTEDFLGKTAWDIFPPEQAIRFEEDDQRLRSGGAESLLVELPMHYKERDYWIWTGKTLLEPDNRDESHLSGFSIDITQRKEAEEAVKRQQALFHSVIDTDPNLIFVKDADSNYLLINRAFAEMLETNVEDVMERGIAAVFPSPEEAAARRKIDLAVLESGKPITSEQCRIRSDGSERWYLTTKTPLPMADGTVSILGIGIDITEQRKAQNLLRQAKENAEAATKTKSDFLAMMSHEIRTPMNGVIGMTSLLQETELTAEQRDFVETIRSSGEALLTIINDILDFSKMDGGHIALEKKPFSLREMIEDIYELLAARPGLPPLDLCYRIAPDICEIVVGDRQRLRQVLTNLIGNALKFTQTGGVMTSVRLVDGKTGDSAPRLHFAVQDTGIGIQAQKFPDLFEPFIQVGSSGTPLVEGTGLGLAISKRLVERMGGEIGVESEVGVGSRFHFTVQMETDEAAQSVDREAQRTLLAGKTVAFRTGHPLLGGALAHWIEDAGGQPMELGPDQPQMLHTFRERGADLLLVDSAIERDEWTAIFLAGPTAKYTPTLLLAAAGRRINGEDYQGILSKPLKWHHFLRGAALALGRLDQFPSRATRRPVTPGSTVNLAHQIPLRILLVEDNAVNQKLALTILGKMGYAADLASNGLEAVEAALHTQYDLILMDVLMPELDGLDATRRIRSKAQKHTPVIVAMTANVMATDQRVCCDVGMDDYIAKPVTAARLRAKIVELFANSKA